MHNAFLISKLRHVPLILAIFALTAIAYSGNSQAQPIPIANSNFETPSLASKDYLGYSGSTQYSWVRDAGYGGIFQPGSGSFNPGAGPGENNAAWLSEGWLGQNLSATFQPGTYVLTVSLGIANLPRFVTPYINAPVNGLVNDPTFLAASADPTTLRMVISWNFQGSEYSSRAVQRSEILPGSFADFSTTLIINPGDFRIGRSIGIAFNEASGDVTYFAIDNVRLNFAPVPEPASWLMVLGGLFYLVSLNYRRIGRTYG